MVKGAVFLVFGEKFLRFPMMSNAVSKRILTHRIMISVNFYSMVSDCQILCVYIFL